MLRYVNFAVNKKKRQENSCRFIYLLISILYFISLLLFQWFIFRRQADPATSSHLPSAAILACAGQVVESCRVQRSCL
jgi:hypothetical protein